MAHSGIRDDGAYFVIVPSTRKITVPQSHKILGIVGDHNSEEITFQCPKTIDGHEVMNCAEHFVRFKNANGQTDDVDIPSSKIRLEGDNIYLTWVIGKDVTESAGNISISVHFIDRDNNGNIIYKWGTTPCTECQILDGQTDDNPIDKPTIPDGYVRPEGTISITRNGTHNVAGKEFADVQVGSNPPLQSKLTKTNGEVTPDAGFYGLSKVIVAVPGEDVQLTPVNIDKNGTFYPTGDTDGFSSVNVSVKPNLQDKTVDKNGTVRADSSYDGLGTVTVNVEPNLQNKTVKTNGEVTADAGYDGLGTVMVEVPTDTTSDFVPSGTHPITNNGEHDVYNYAKVNVNVPIPDGYVIPSGDTETITENGRHNVSGKAVAVVNVPNVIPDGYVKPVGSRVITSNGDHDVTELKSISVAVPEPSGNLNITSNGDYNVKDKETVNVYVANVIPDGYVKPTGTKEITTNGEYDVYDKSQVNVNVPVPELQSKEITTNGTFTALTGTAYNEVIVDVKPNLQNKTINANEDDTNVIVTPDDGYDGLSSVQVNISRNQYSKQTKVITLTENGTTHIMSDSGYDGLEKVSVTVAIPEYDGTVN